MDAVLRTVASGKWRAASLAVLLLAAAPARATITQTGHGGAQGGTHSATSIAVTVTAAVNDTVIVFCAETSTGSCTSVTDNASPANTYTAGPSQTTNVLTKIFYSLNITHSTTTVTVTVSGAEGAVTVGTYGGVQAVGNTGTNSGSSTVAAVTVTTQDANNWVVQCGGGAGSATWSAGSGSNFRQSAFSATTGGEISAESSDSGAVASPGAQTVNANLSASEAWGAVGLELRSVVPAACGGSSAIALLGVGCR